MAYPRSITEALNLSLEQLAPFGDFGGVMMCQMTETHPSSEIDNILATQLLDNGYESFNVSSLGSIARIIVSGQNSRLVSQAQAIYDNYRRWHRLGSQG